MFHPTQRGFNPRIIDNEVCPIYKRDIARLNASDKMFVTRAGQQLIYREEKTEIYVYTMRYEIRRYDATQLPVLQ